MSIECGDYEEASTLLDVLIGRLVDELQSTIDEYQDEVEVVDGRLEWAEDADEEVDEEEAGEDSSDDEDDDDEPYETATHMMPRLLVDKAVLAARQKQFNYSEELFENALELDCADPYVVLTAIEEYFEPHEQWDQIIFYFRQLPLIDRIRERSAFAAPEHLGDDHGFRGLEPADLRLVSPLRRQQSGVLRTQRRPRVAS